METLHTCQTVLVMVVAAVSAGQFNVTGPPSTVTILKDTVKAQLGEPITLNCSDDQPVSGVWWRHKGRNISSAPSLLLPSLACNDLGTYMCLHDSAVLVVVDVEVQTLQFVPAHTIRGRPACGYSQCLIQNDLFLPVVSSLSSVAAILLCLTLCFICGACRSRRKHQRNHHSHDNEVLQNDNGNELQDLEPHPQEEARTHVSVVGEPLPPPPPTAPTPPERAVNRDSDGIRLDLQGYVKLDPAKGPISRSWLWTGPDMETPLATPPRRRGSAPFFTEGGALSPATPLFSHSSASLPATPAAPHPLDTIEEGANDEELFWSHSAEHAPMYVGGAERLNTPPYTSQGEILTPLDFLDHGLNQEQAPDAAPRVFQHQYQNVADWWKNGTEELNLSCMVAHGNQDFPYDGHDDISAGQISHDTSPPCAGYQGNSPAQAHYENIVVPKEDY